MLPYYERAPDYQYYDILALIMSKKAKVVESRQGKKCRRIIAPPPMHFKLENGFPVITERSLKGFWTKGIDEICAFINGVRTTHGLEERGVTWWNQWASPEKCAKRGLENGDLGPGSYGAAFHDFPTAKGPMNQFQHLIEQIRDEPELRTHFVSPWIPQFNMRGVGKVHKAVVSPCHGWIHVFADADKKMSLHMFQRSADFPIGVPFNMIQYAALLMMLARVTDHVPYEFIHSCSDAHIYEDQEDAVRVMLTRPPRQFPTVIMNPKNDLFAFRGGDFALSDYHPHPSIPGIPVAT